VEETVDDIYELLPRVYLGQNNYGPGWCIKKNILNEFNKAIITTGQKIYISSKHYKYGVKIIKEYLDSKNCSRALSSDTADVILTVSYAYPKEIYSLNNLVDKPVEVAQVIRDRHKYMYADHFYNNVRDYVDSKRPRFEFDFNIYENIWMMLTTNQYDNIRMAAASIMTANWTGNEFLLEFLVINFNYQMRSGHLATIPGWSAFANKNNLAWKSKEVYAWSIVQMMKKYLITPEQTQLIHNLLNKTK